MKAVIIIIGFIIVFVIGAIAVALAHQAFDDDDDDMYWEDGQR